MQYTVEEIRSKIQNEQKWTERAVIALYHRQTGDEKQIQHTRHDNDRGFNKPDSTRMTIYAKRILYGRGHLTELELAWTQRRIGKYARQLWKVAKENEHTQVRREPRQLVAEASQLELLPGYWPKVIDFNGREFTQSFSKVDNEYEVLFVAYKADNGDILKVLND